MEETLQLEHKMRKLF